MSKDNRDMLQTGWTTPELPPHLQKAREELSDKDLVTQTLRDHITGEVDLTSAQVQSVNILAKASGMYTTRIEDVTPMSSEDLRDRLRRKLEYLADEDGYKHWRDWFYCYVLPDFKGDVSLASHTRLTVTTTLVHDLETMKDKYDPVRKQWNQMQAIGGQ